MPKTGSSFENTLVRWACGSRSPNINVFSGRANVQAPKDARALLGQSSCLSKKFVTRKDPGTGRVKSPNHLGQHMPLRGNESVRTLARVMMLFRSPDARAWSEFKQNFPRASRVCPSCVTPRDMCGVYDRFGRGHMAKYILGCHPLLVCNNQSLPSASLTYACEQTKRMGFVGITDLWPASICLFHKTLGGGTDSRDLHNSRPGIRSWTQPPSVRQKRNCTDRSDAYVFICALREFLARTHRTGCDAQLQNVDLQLPGANAMLQRSLQRAALNRHAMNRHAHAQR